MANINKVVLDINRIDEIHYKTNAGQVVTTNGSTVEKEIADIKSSKANANHNHDNLYASKNDFDAIKDQISQNKPIVINNDTAVGTIVYMDKSGQIPDGWLICDGTELSTSEYSELFSVIGYKHGGESGFFKLPNVKGSNIIINTDEDDVMRSNVIVDQIAIIKARAMSQDMITIAKEVDAVKGDFETLNDAIDDKLKSKANLIHDHDDEYANKKEFEEMKDKISQNKPIVISNDTPIGSIAFVDKTSSQIEGWLICDGRLINVNDYQDLFEVIGYTHGGSEGQFALPNIILDNLIVGGIDDAETTINEKIVKSQVGIIKAKKVGENMITVAQEWTSFKENGGEIGGGINVNGVIHSNNSISGKRIQIFENSLTASKTTGEWGSLEIDSVGPGASYFKKADNTIVVLGTESQPFDNLFLNGFNKGTNGYTKLPNGMIIQWGVVADTPPVQGGYESGRITFPIAFPNVCLGYSANCSYNNTTNNAYYTDNCIVNAVLGNSTGFQLRINTVFTMPYQCTFSFSWFAIGY